MIDDDYINSLIKKNYDQLQSINKQLEKALAPLNLQEEIKKNLAVNKELSSQLEVIAEHARDVYKDLDWWAAAVKNSFAGVQSSWLNDLLRRVQSGLTADVIKLAKSMEAVPPRTKQALMLMAEHGWYLDLEMAVPYLFKIESVLKEGGIAQVDVALSKHYSERIDGIESSVIERHPNREKIIKAAFLAHRRGEYELSVPVILAQADGICTEEAAGLSFFRNRKGKPQTAEFVEGITINTFKEAIFSPLALVLPINIPEGARSEGFVGLNRHTVVHGESTDYGTEINSLKAISFLNYVVHIFDRNVHDVT